MFQTTNQFWYIYISHDIYSIIYISQQKNTWGIPHSPTTPIIKFVCYTSPLYIIISPYIVGWLSLFNHVLGWKKQTYGGHGISTMPQIHIDPEHPSFLWNQSSSNPQKYVLGSMEFYWRLGKYHWIGFIGKIFTGNHGIFTIKKRGFPITFSLKPIQW